MELLHNGFFYACYAIAATILLHRALSGAVGVGKETPQEVVEEVTADDPQLLKDDPQESDVWTYYFPSHSQYATYVTKPAAMPAHTATVGTTADDYSVRQLRDIAKERGNGRVKNYKNISKGALFGRLRELR